MPDSRATPIRRWTQSLTKSRYVWDCILLISFIIIMSPNLTTITGHEWLSVLFLIPFAVHLLLHWHWIIETGSGLVSTINQQNRWHFVLDTLLYMTMTFAIASGFLASEALLLQIGFDFKADPFWTQVHHQYSNLLFPIVGVHIAVHWSWVVRTTRRMFGAGETS